MANKPVLRDQRIRIMEGVLAWEGEIGNARVRQLFGLMPVQASRLLAEFRTVMGGLITEDGRAKVLRAAAPDTFGTHIPLDEYARHTLADDEHSSCVIDARIDLTTVRPEVFACLRKGALTNTGVVISYASMTTPRFDERTIFPHSIIHIGRRWHVRGWCARREEFRDFTLGRIRSAFPVPDAAPRTIDDDRAWHRIVVLELTAHRKLSTEQQAVARFENFGGSAGRQLPVRACLAQYVIQDLRASIDPEREVPPEFQLEIANASQLTDTFF